MGTGSGFNIFLASWSKAKNHGARCGCSRETPVISFYLIAWGSQCNYFGNSGSAYGVELGFVIHHQWKQFFGIKLTEITCIMG